MRVGFVFIDSTIAISVLLFICQTVAVRIDALGLVIGGVERITPSGSLGPIRFATAIGISGLVSGIVAVGLGGLMSVLALKLYINRSDQAARKVFFGSLAYLPIVLGVMVIDRGPTSDSPVQATTTMQTTAP